ncbi:MAG: thiamine phosphate synthase [Acidimicrobiales bacterium]
MADRRLYFCTPARPDLERFLESCIRGGVDIVQLREKSLADRPLLEVARRARTVCAASGVPFILNDRPDLALECEADGVHVGQEDAPPALVRRVVGSEVLVGLSTHGPASLSAALGEPVDYLSAGPVVPTPTKPGRPWTGLGYLSTVASSSRLPWFVTGGVTPDGVPALAAAGARRFVVVRWLTEAADPESHARQLRVAIDAAVERSTSA